MFWFLFLSAIFLLYLAQADRASDSAAVQFTQFKETVAIERTMTPPIANLSHPIEKVLYFKL